MINMAILIGIYISPQHKAPLQAIPTAQLQAGYGIVGDRFHSQLTTAAIPRPNKEITLIQVEHIDHFNTATSQTWGYGDFRRNLITQGIDLNALVNQHFMLGNTELKGLQLCEPCNHLAKYLGNNVMAGLKHKGGLRARIITGGNIAVGDAIRLCPPYNLSIF
jgi:MOSC domain-containing protein YiiM